MMLAGNSTKDQPTIDDVHNQLLMEYLPLICTYSLVGCIGVIGNVITVAFYAKERPSSTASLIVSLACIDVSVCLTSFGMVADMSMNVTLSNPIQCKVTYFLVIWAVYASTLTLWAISIDRYSKICYPLKKQLSIKGARILTVVIVGVAAFFSSRVLITQKLSTLLLHIDNNNSTSLVNGHMCNEATDEELGTLKLVFQIVEVVCALIVCSTLVVTYGKIVRTLIRHYNEFESVGGKLNRSQIHKSKSSCQSVSSTVISERSDTNVDAEENYKQKEGENAAVSLSTVLGNPCDKNRNQYVDHNVEQKCDHHRGGQNLGRMPEENEKYDRTENRPIEETGGPEKVTGSAHPYSDMDTVTKDNTDGLEIKDINAEVKVMGDDNKPVPKREKRLNLGKSERRATVMMLTVSVGFLLCFVPYMMVRFFNKKWHTGTVDDFSVATWIPFLLPTINSVINPLLYCVLNRRYRYFVRKVCIRWRV